MFVRIVISSSTIPITIIHHFILEPELFSEASFFVRESVSEIVTSVSSDVIMPAMFFTAVIIPSPSCPSLNAGLRILLMMFAQRMSVRTPSVPSPVAMSSFLSWNATVRIAPLSTPFFPSSHLSKCRIAKSWMFSPSVVGTVSTAICTVVESFKSRRNFFR